MVRAEVNKPEGDLLASDLRKVTFLSLQYKETSSILSLEGIQYEENLSHMVGDWSRVEDWMPLVNSKSLMNITIGGKTFNNVEPLTVLTQVSQLLISGNQVHDLSPLSKITNLTDLLAGNNPIEAMPDLSKLTHLRWFDFSETHTRDISFLTNHPSLEVVYMPDTIVRI